MKRIIVVLAVLATAGLLAPAARSAELITNGGFETGNFTGWTPTNAANPWINWNVSGPGAGGGFIPVPVATSPPQGVRVAWQGIAANAGSPFTLDQTVTIPPAATASIMWRHRFQMNLSEFCGGSGEPACGNAVYSVQVLNTSNTVLQTLYTITAPGAANTDTGWRLNLRSLNAFAGQTIKIRFITTVSITWAGPGQLEVDAVSIQTPAVVTAANATISGRLTTSDGTPVNGGIVSLSGGNGESRTAMSNPFGYYVFNDVPTGLTYVIGATSRRYFFPDSPVAITLSGDLTNVNFQASP
jgi:hypothetical protein